jgi:hypothetical protein
VMAGRRTTLAFCAVRPPVTTPQPGDGGVCFVDNVAVAARRALGRHGLRQLAIVDPRAPRQWHRRHWWARRAHSHAASGATAQPGNVPVPIWLTCRACPTRGMAVHSGRCAGCPAGTAPAENDLHPALASTPAKRTCMGQMALVGTTLDHQRTSGRGPAPCRAASLSCLEGATRSGALARSVSTRGAG